MYESARYESALFRSVLVKINIDRTLILTHAAPTCVDILFGNKSGNKLKTPMESAEGGRRVSQDNGLVNRYVFISE